MQLGMIGLGRMGANMTRRLVEDGHTCVVFDMLPEAVQELAAEMSVGAKSLADLVTKLAKPRFRVSPSVTLAIGVTVMDDAERSLGQQVELLISHHPGIDEPDAYERVLGDAMEGDSTLFAREDYVEEAWRIVDPVIGAGTPAYPYDPGQWGPAEAQRLEPPGGWDHPIVTSS